MAEQVKDYKPSPAHFSCFSRVSGVAIDNWIHAACSWYHDIAPARALGLRRIRVDRDRTGEDPSTATRRVESVAELPEAVRWVEAARD